MSLIGRPITRVDGPKKVTGAATYAAEFAPSGMVYAAVVQSTIAQGRITSIDSAEALRVPGVLSVLTPWNTMSPKMPWGHNRQLVDPSSGDMEKPLANDLVLHQGQHIALVVAETRNAARHAAGLVHVAYEADAEAITSIHDAVAKAEAGSGTGAEQSYGRSIATRVVETVKQAVAGGDPSQQAPGRKVRGNPDGAYDDAPVRTDTTYVMPRENNNPMEPHACIAEWHDDMLTVWDKTQWVQNDAASLAKAFGIGEDQVHVINPYVGGAFGSALRVWPHTFLAAIAAKEVGRPVHLELSRREYYGGTGYRPWTKQRVRLGADRDGHLLSLSAEAIAETSTYEDYSEATLRPAGVLHNCDNVELLYKLAHRATTTPTPMRAPGETTGLYALECAMDELAVALEMDPVELRLRNIPPRDKNKDLPFSSISVEQCLRDGSAKFGWERRPMQAGTLKDGRLMVGMGMASAIYPTNIAPAKARARLLPDGRVEVMTAASDMGPGTWTSLTQVAADTLGIPIDRVKLEIGDNKLPQAPVHGGSMTMASVGNAVQDACLRLIEAVRAKTRVNEGDLSTLAAKLDGPVEAEGSHTAGDLTKKFASYAFGAVFAEVAIDPDTAETRVRRVVGAYGAGQIINPRLARSQCIGGFIQGVGQALMEHTEVDNRTARVVNANFAEYLIPVLADTPELEVIFVPESDPHLGPLGAKGLGEVALCGIGPAIANAVYHATGRRVRDLPITPDKLAGL